MAANASDDRVRADIRPPDFRAAIAKIRTQLVAKKKRVGEINGEISDIWAKIEGHKVNKGAAKTFAKLDGMEHVDRADFIRSLNGLMDASGWPKEATDLVDGAEGKVVQMHVGQGNDNEEGEEEPDPEVDEDPDRSRSARRGRGIAGLDKARGHLNGGATAA